MNMNICPVCGKQIPAITKNFCPFCGNKIEFPEPEQVEQVINTVTTTRHNPPVKGMPIMSEGETCVKSYHCAMVKGINGYLTVTNKRLIFHSYANSSSFISKEILLDSVSGISCLRGTNYSVGKIVLGALLAILGIILLCAGKGGGLIVLGLAVIGIGVLIIVAAIKSTYSLQVYSSKAEASPIDLGVGATSLLGNRALLSVACDPTPDTYTMMNELGALILELQTLGDHAINKWKK